MDTFFLWVYIIIWNFFFFLPFTLWHGFESTSLRLLSLFYFFFVCSSGDFNQRRIGNCKWSGFGAEPQSVPDGSGKKKKGDALWSARLSHRTCHHMPLLSFYPTHTQIFANHPHALVCWEATSVEHQSSWPPCVACFFVGGFSPSSGGLQVSAARAPTHTYAPRSWEVFSLLCSEARPTTCFWS